LSFFFHQLCAKEIDLVVISSMEHEAVALHCKLNKIFSPGFFKRMQHLILHLPYEAGMGRHVQFRWCYVIEREQKNLREKCKNKSRIEATIAEAFILEEHSNFTTKYFGENVRTIHNLAPR
jgi:hypothetical protein